MNVQGFYALLLTAILYGTVGIFIRFLQSDFNDYQQIFYLNIPVILLLLLFSQIFGYRVSLKNVNKKYLIIYGMLYGLVGALFTFSVLNGTIVTTVLSLYAASFTVSLVLGHFFFHELLTKKKVIGFLLALSGILVYSYPFSFALLGPGFLYGFAAGTVEAFANASNKFLSDKVPVPTMIFGRMLGGSIVGFILLILFSSDSLFPTLSFGGVITMVSLAVVVLIMAFTVVKGFQSFDLNLGTIIISSEIIFAAVFAALIFQEYPTLNQLIGGFFIFSAIVVANIATRRIGKRVKPR